MIRKSQYIIYKEHRLTDGATKIRATPGATSCVAVSRALLREPGNAALIEEAQNEVVARLWHSIYGEVDEAIRELREMALGSMPHGPERARLVDRLDALARQIRE